MNMKNRLFRSRACATWLCVCFTMLWSCAPKPELAEVAPAPTVSAESETTVAPFTMPVPSGWRTETIPFPLSFAPDLLYEGVEELRFSPGMFDQDSEMFFSYGFVWWIKTRGPAQPEVLERQLASYFRGLADNGEADLGEAQFEVTLSRADGGRGDDGRIEGTANIFETFTTNGQVMLNVQVDEVSCLTEGLQVLFFGLSPQSKDHPVWEQLASIRDGTRCASPE